MATSPAPIAWNKYPCPNGLCHGGKYSVFGLGKCATNLVICVQLGKFVWRHGPALGAYITLPTSGRDYFCRSPNRAKRMECVQLAAAFAALRPIQTFGHSRKRQQAARTPYASRGSVTDTNSRTHCGVLHVFS